MTEALPAGVADVDVPAAGLAAAGGGSSHTGRCAMRGSSGSQVCSGEPGSAPGAVAGVAGVAEFAEVVGLAFGEPVAFSPSASGAGRQVGSGTCGDPVAEGDTFVGAFVGVCVGAVVGAVVGSFVGAFVVVCVSGDFAGVPVLCGVSVVASVALVVGLTVPVPAVPV